jgi:hypothetical protein
MKVFLAFFNEKAIKLGGCSFRSFILPFSDWSHELKQFGFLIRWEQIRYFIGVKQIIDVFNEALILDL